MAINISSVMIVATAATLAGIMLPAQCCPLGIAGEAVRSRLSPDGSTLAILTAGQNSLYKSDGTVDVANSTQYIFSTTWRAPTGRRPRSSR
jgi:hypothetical protein